MLLTYLFYKVAWGGVQRHPLFVTCNFKQMPGVVSGLPGALVILKVASRTEQHDLCCK